MEILWHILTCSCRHGGAVIVLILRKAIRQEVRGRENGRVMPILSGLRIFGLTWLKKSLKRSIFS